MLTIEIIAVLALLVALIVYAVVRTQLQRRKMAALGEAGRGARILVVDDDPDFVKITEKVLNTHGYETETASSGAEALKLLRAARTKPQLILLDIMMDYITDGLDVSAEIRKDPTLKDVPVVMVTSLTAVKGQEIFPSDEHVAIDAWLNKPVTPQDLLQIVQETLARVTKVAPASAAVTS
jgi:CheY-like chemotaxis protein